MSTIVKRIILIGTLFAVGGYGDTLSAANLGWNYGTSESPIYITLPQLPTFTWSWNYGTSDIPVWFSFGSSENNNSGINVEIITNTSGSENSSSSLQKEEIIENASNPTYSPDGKSFAYVKKNGGKYVVVKDGVEGTEYGYISQLAYSPDGKGFAYEASANGNSNDSVIIRDEKIESQKYTSTDGFIYSPDGKSFAYIVHANDGKYFLVKDGVESNRYDYINSAVYSPDSMSFTFTAKQNDAFVIVKDGVELPKRYYKFRSKPVYSWDGKTLTYSAVDIDGKNILVKDGIELDIKDMMALETSYSSDRTHFAYLASSGYSAFIVNDSVESSSYRGAQYLRYSPDGKSFAYAASIEKEKYVVIKDGIELPGEVDPWFTDKIFMYSPDSKSFSYVIKVGDKYKIIKDGIESISYDDIEDMIYSPDSKEFAYIAKVGDKRMVVRNGVEGTKYDFVFGLSYSPDNKSFYYTTKSGEKDLIIKQNY